jgi:hypothetical protein
MGVMTSSGLSSGGGGMSSSWFTHRSREGEQVGAVVIWRRKPKPGHVPRRIRFPRLYLLFFRLFIQTGMLHRFWYRGFEAWMHGSFKAADADRAAWEAELNRRDPEEEQWSGGSGMGRDKIRYSERRRVVGFRGRVYGPPPDGQAMLLLLEDDDTAPDGVRVIERSFTIPDLPPIPRPNASMSDEERGRLARVRHERQGAILSAAFESDAEYQRFIKG